MKHVKYLFLLIALMSARFLFAGDPIPMDPRVVTGTLDNGMTYYIQHNEKPEDRVELRLAVRTGSIMEDEDQLGLAHFVEHMAFNGTENFEKSELVDFLESIGTRFGPDLNAYTSFDETVYMLQVRTDEEGILDKGLTVMEDWAGGLLFDHEEIDKERGVVISEWRTGLGPDQRMQNRYFPVMYHKSRYAERLPIGDPEIVETADYDVVKRFYRDWYRPNLMALVVVGDIDVEKMEMQIKERFSDLENPDNERERKEFSVPKHQETLVAIESEKEASFTNAQVMYKHPQEPIEHLRDYRKMLMRSLYNRMLGARLDELSQEADPPFNFAYTGYSRDVGDIDTYSSYAFTAEGGALRGLEAVLIENERVLRHGFTQTELDRMKEDMLSWAEKSMKEMDKTESGRLAMRYVYHYLDDNPIPSPKQMYELYKEMLPGITLAEVNELPKKWVTDENRVVVLTGPEKEEAPMPTEQEVRELLAEVSDMKLEAYEDDVSDAPLLSVALTPVGITRDVEMKNVGVTEWTLENGVKVVLKPTDFKNDEMLMYAFSEGGHSLYGDESYYSASNADAIIDESGVGEFDVIQLQKKLSGKIVSVTPYIGEMYEGMRGSASPDDMKEMFELVYLYFTAPRMDETAFTSYITKNKAIYANLMSNPQYYFMDYGMKVKTDNHPRRQFPTVESLEQIDPEEVFKIYRERFADASDFTFVFTGTFDMDKMREMAATYLGNLPTLDREETWRDVNADYVKGVVEKTITRGEAPKALVDITFHGSAKWTKENRYAMRSLIEVLRIKMRESMREDIGGVYGVRLGGSIDHYPKEEYSINISFNAEPEMVETLVDAAFTEIRNAMENGAEEKDLEKVRETQKQSMTKSLKENRFWQSQISFAYRNELDPSNITMEYMEEQIATLDSDMIRDAANDYFDFNSMIKLVMYPEAKEMEN